MDIIHLFISDILIDFITSDKYDIVTRKVSMDSNFYDIDTYLAWSKKEVESLARHHIRLLFDDVGESLEKYYQEIEKARKNPSFLVSLKESLEGIFPFMRRIKNSLPILFKYLDMLEILYDDIDKKPTKEPDQEQNQEIIYKECKQLGIKISINENPADLLALYKNNLIHASQMTLKGMKDFIQQKAPTIGLSRRNRNEIVNLFNSIRN
jgi:hypothetical protein